MPTDIGLVMSGEINLWFDPERIGEGPADKFARGAPIGFTAVLAGYVIADGMAGAVGAVRMVSHLPALVGTVLALLGQPAGAKELTHH